MACHALDEGADKSGDFSSGPIVNLFDYLPYLSAGKVL